MGHGISYIKSISYLLYGPLYADLDSIQIGFGLLVTVQVLRFFILLLEVNKMVNISVLSLIKWSI